MSIEQKNPKKRTEIYIKLSLHYSDNAQKFLNNKEYEKASEMMWGSMASMLKAVAANKGVLIKKHGGLFGFANKLSKEMKDPEIFHSFSLAGNLHSNFYESDIDEQTLRKIIKRVARTIGKLMTSMGYRVP